MNDKPFYCKVVDMRITGDVCETRIRQAKEFRDKGDPHASLDKCVKCKGLVPTEAPVAPKEPVENNSSLICGYCGLPPEGKNSAWVKKTGMHQSCQQSKKRGCTPRGSKPEVKVERPTVGVKVTTVEQPENPERIIQCSASPSWVRCHGCYAAKNCAIYDAATTAAQDEPSVADTVKVICTNGSCGAYDAKRSNGCLKFNDVGGCDTYNAYNHEFSQPSGSTVPDTSEQNHYTACAIQPIDFIVANSMDFLEGNIVKYVARYKRKNGLEDLAKARHYLDMLIDREDSLS